mgnify:FL=1
MSVSIVGFGAWAIGKDKWGDDISDETSIAALEKAFELGVTLFDTADAYGDGESERIVGKFLQGKRNAVFLATKGGINITIPERSRDFSAAYLAKACEASLSRLGTDYIDLYQLHNPSIEEIRRGEIFETLKGLKTAGKIRATGVSVWNPEELDACLANGAVDVLQVNFNALRQDNLPGIRKAASSGIGIIANQPLAAGLLTGKYSKNSSFPPTDHRGGSWTPETFESNAKKLGIVADATRAPFASSAQVAVAFVLANAEVTSTVVGAKRPAQIAQTAAAADLALPPSVFDALLDG